MEHMGNTFAAGVNAAANDLHANCEDGNVCGGTVPRNNMQRNEAKAAVAVHANTTNIAARACNMGAGTSLQPAQKITEMETKLPIVHD
ncbi:hypothetical protein HPP92_016542 [Vanilla planifolia]|uniref:Uncharacterized protein n=1 Tax=Vanilla planifolia TaxID=51239 RepID=A0A835QLD7_VANPL|nr:hypothetical protein HPP92_016542 [Vanilla planifolia]